jgi:hypothetical protein
VSAFRLDSPTACEQAANRTRLNTRNRTEAPNGRASTSGQSGQKQMSQGTAAPEMQFRNTVQLNMSRHLQETFPKGISSHEDLGS